MPVRHREIMPGDMSPLRLLAVSKNIWNVFEEHQPKFILRISGAKQPIDYGFNGVGNLGHLLQVDLFNTTDTTVKVEIITRYRITSREELLEKDPSTYAPPPNAPIAQMRQPLITVYTEKVKPNKGFKMYLDYMGQLAAPTDGVYKREDYELDLVMKGELVRVINRPRKQRHH